MAIQKGPGTVHQAAAAGALLQKENAVLVISESRETRRILLERLAASRYAHFSAIELDSLQSNDLPAALTETKAVILDVDVTGPAGFQQVSEAVQAARSLPVVVVGHLSGAMVADAVLQRGAQDYLCLETLEHEDLGRCLHYAIERHTLCAQLTHHLFDLEQTKARFRSLIIDNADALLIIDSGGVVRFANPAAEKLLQQSANELAGSEIGVAIGTGEEPEIDLTLKDGRQITVAMRFMETLWDGVRAYIATLRDITYRKDTERNLRRAMEHALQASEMKSRFLANMSHELRTPLNSIIGFAELMSLQTYGAIGNARYLGYLNNIKTSGDHLLGLIDDLLDLSKVEADKLELVESEFLLPAVLLEVTELVKPRLAEAGLTLEFSAQGPEPLLLGDPRRFKQIIFNLLSNAIKFTPEGGRVTIGYQPALDGGLVVTVEDTGVGIPEDQIPQALSAFGQIQNASPQNAQEGTGLGLAVSKELVELHGGLLTIKSKLGHGTRVSIAWPTQRVLSHCLHTSVG